MASLVDGELMTQGEHLKLEGHPCSETGAEGSEEGKENSLHGGTRLTYLSRADLESLTPSPLLRERP